MKPETVQHHVNQVDYFLRAFAECKDDLKAAKNGHVPHYNLDFSLLVPVLFDRKSSGSKGFLYDTREGMKKVLSHVPSVKHHQLVVSGATVVEFYDQIAHIVQDIERRVPKTLERLRKLPDGRIEQLLKSSAEIRSDLSLLLDGGISTVIDAPINRFLNLLDQHVVMGVGDFVSGSELSGTDSKEMFDRFLQEHRMHRLARDSDRPVEDSIFHYKMDSANNCLTIAINSKGGFVAPFVTPTPLNIRQCDSTGLHAGRLDKVPLMMLNLQAMKAEGFIRDEESWLDRAIGEAISLNKELVHYPLHSRSKELPTMVSFQLVRFYQEFVSVILNTGDNFELKQSIGVDVDELMGRLRDATNLKDRLQSVTEEARESAKVLELHSSNFNIPYLDQFDFKSDPVVERIRKTLDIKLD